MNTIEKIQKAIEKSNYNGYIVVDDNGKFDHIKLARTGGHASKQKVWLSKTPSRMTISEIVNEINSTIKINNPQNFIDTH